MRRYIVILLLLIVAGGLCIVLTKDFPKAPPTIYTHARIITVNEQQPTAEAMLVVDGKIAAIGTEKQVRKASASDVRIVDMKGASILPGFIDVHTHFALSMFLEKMHDLSGFTHESNHEVWAYFEEAVKHTPPNEWVICKGLDPILVPDLETPSIQYLDSIAPDRPVVIFSQSLHSYWVNSAAFERVGITEQSKDPSEHSYYEKDQQGRFTGLIVEQEAFQPFGDKIKEEVLTASVLSEASKDVMLAYAGNGNTSIVSTGLTISEPGPLLLLEHLSAEQPSFLGNVLEILGQLPTREAMPRHFVYIRHDAPQLLPDKRGAQNDFYDIIGVKHWYDGSPYIGSMYMSEPYLDTEFSRNKLDIASGSKGKALIEKEALKHFIQEYHKKGWQVAIHAQGDAAIEEIIQAFQELDTELDVQKARHRLEHCLLLPVSELDAIKQLNLTPSFHINHLYYYGDALSAEILGQERTKLMLPVRSALEKEILVSLHADQPMFESKPFRLIQTAVERKTKSGMDLGMAERLNIMEAIKALTIHAAWQIHMEDKLGSLEQGKYADFIVLDKHPLEVPIEELHAIECLETYIHGNKVNPANHE